MKNVIEQEANMALKNLSSWASNAKDSTGTACGAACGAGGKPDSKPDTKPSACGSACGAGSPDKK